METGKKVLHLTLKKKWFDMIASGEKKEEYREMKPYFVSRFCDKHIGAIGGDFMDAHKVISYTFRQFDLIVFKNGYSSSCPEMLVEFNGFEIGSGNPKWGGGGNNLFILKLGKILSTKNL